MAKITFIGAGSLQFTRRLARDIFTFPLLKDAKICLLDINAERLKFAKESVQRIIDMGNYPATVEATMNRAEALQDADAVLCTILSGDTSVWRYDIEIPMKYGIDFNVGDTRGIAGMFRALRTIPVMLDIIKDVERYCPRAIFLNYTNPMAMLCRAMQSRSQVQISGLCHSVQGTAGMLSQWIGAPSDEIT
jgi:alpha-galactosidase